MEREPKWELNVLDKIEAKNARWENTLRIRPKTQSRLKDPQNLDFTGKLEVKYDQIYIKGDELLKRMHVENPGESRLTANTQTDIGILKNGTINFYHGFYSLLLTFAPIFCLNC